MASESAEAEGTRLRAGLGAKGGSILRAGGGRGLMGLIKVDSIAAVPRGDSSRLPGAGAGASSSTLAEPVQRRNTDAGGYHFLDAAASDNNGGGGGGGGGGAGGGLGGGRSHSFGQTEADRPGGWM